VTRGREQVEQLARRAVDCAFHLNRDIGRGWMENVYEMLLALKLERRGIEAHPSFPENRHLH
jgi:hypothetical protein